MVKIMFFLSRITFTEVIVCPRNAYKEEKSSAVLYTDTDTDTVLYLHKSI